MKRAPSSFLARWNEAWQCIQADAAQHGSFQIQRTAEAMGITRQALSDRMKRARARGLLSDADLAALKPPTPEGPTVDIQVNNLPVDLVARLDALATERGRSRSAQILEILEAHFADSGVSL
jgi:hypothetical protein